MLDFEGLVRIERTRQDDKWGEQNHNPQVWLSILMEEVGELASATLFSMSGIKKHPDKKIGNEIIQIAAVCKAMWESGERNRWV